MTAIYALCHPETMELRYIGKANQPRERLAGHLRDSRTRKTPLYAWVRKLTAAGLKPEVVILRECSGNWRKDEQELIARGRVHGHRLLNLADGGDQPYCSPEQRTKNAKALQSHPKTIANRKANFTKMQEVMAGTRQAKSLGSFAADKKAALAQHFTWSARLWSRLGDTAMVSDRANKLRAINVTSV